MHTYILTYIHTYTHTCTYIHIHIHTYSNIHTYIAYTWHTYVHTHVACTYLHMCLCLYLHKLIRSQLRGCLDPCSSWCVAWLEVCQPQLARAPALWWWWWRWCTTFSFRAFVSVLLSPFLQQSPLVLFTTHSLPFILAPRGSLFRSHWPAVLGWACFVGRGWTQHFRYASIPSLDSFGETGCVLQLQQPPIILVFHSFDWCVSRLFVFFYSQLCRFG